MEGSQNTSTRKNIPLGMIIWIVQAVVIGFLFFAMQYGMYAGVGASIWTGVTVFMACGSFPLGYISALVCMRVRDSVLPLFRHETPVI